MQITNIRAIGLVVFGAAIHRCISTLIGLHEIPSKRSNLQHAISRTAATDDHFFENELPDIENYHFAPNPLDNEQHFPANELGMLGEPLTVKTARLCDQQKQALLEKKWFWCPEDPTCRQCARSWDRNTNVTVAFNDPDHKEQRKKLYRTAFKTVPFNTVTVQAVNHGQVHLWLNWICSCEAHGFDVRESTLVVPTDADAHRVVTEAGFHSVGLDWQSGLSHGVHSGYDGKAGSSQQHSDINNILMLTSGELIEHGHHVLMIDVDIAWIRDPRSWLSNDALSADILAMVAARWDAQGTANTGMVFMRSNRRTHLFMQSVINLFPIKGWSDQVLFNMVLRHYQMRQVSFHNLPTRLFPVLPGSTKAITKQDWRKEAYTVHAVGGHKEQRLDEAGLMFYNENCSIYGKRLKPWVTIPADGRKQ